MKKWSIVLLTIVWWLSSPVWAGSGEVLLVGDTERPYFRSFQSALQSGLEQGGYAVKVVDIRQTESVLAEVSGIYRCVITVGHETALKSSEWRLGSPVLHALVTQSLAEEMEQAKAGMTPRLYLLVEQPISRLIYLASTIKTRGNRLGVLYGPSSRKYRDDVVRQGRLMEFTLVEKTVSNEAELGSAIAFFKGNTDLLMTLPDPVVVNEGTAKTLLLGAYMSNLPLVGYSQAMVKAGALMSVYSTPEMLGAQSAQIAIAGAWTGSAAFNNRHYPNNFQVSANYQVARALEIDLPSETELATKIKVLEKTR